MGAAHSSVETDRVKKIQIRPYDQVFALTQYIINSGLEQHWYTLCNANEELGKPFSASQPGAGDVMDAILDYPRVQIETGNKEDLSKVLYCMCFRKGKFNLNIAKYDDDGEPLSDDDGNPQDGTTLDMAEWKIAFDMQLGMQLEERVSDNFQRIVLEAGDYSMISLIAKFETAEFRPDKSSWGDQKWNSFPENVREGLVSSFKTLKTTLLSRLDGAQTIGSALKSNKPTDDSVPKLEFEPYQIQYQTYPWVDPEAVKFEPSSGFVGNQRLNYMLYCGTTNERKLPPVGQRMLSRNGNWTDGRLEASANSENSEFGAFHLARENFFDGYLLKKLRFLNRALEPSATRHYVKLENIIDLQPRWDSDLSIGNREDKSENDPFYDWKKVNDSEWEFNSEIKLERAHELAGFHGWSGEAWADTKMKTHNRIYFEPGSDVITVSGKSNVKLDWEMVNKKLFGPEWHNSGLEFTISWQMLLILGAVKDGGLQILTRSPAPVLKIEKNTMSSRFDKADTLLKQAEQALGDTKNLRKALANDLAGKHGLVLPAAGVFFFKNPILSHRGDLICSVAYSNVQPEKAFDPTDQTQINPKAEFRAKIETDAQ